MPEYVHTEIETPTPDGKGVEGIAEKITIADLKPTPQTIARTIVYFITWINMLFAFFGMPQLVIDPDMLTMVLEGIYAIASVVITFVSSTWNGWRNNSYTKAALFGDAMARSYRDLKQDQ